MIKRIVLLLIATVFTAVGNQAVGYAIDERFYSSNNILFYDPNSGQVCTTNQSAVTAPNTPIVGNDNAEKIYNFLTTRAISTNGNKPMTPVQAAAMIGNFVKESRLDPKAVNSIGATGIAQWLGGRKTALMKLDNPLTLKTQLNFVTLELQGSEKGLIYNDTFKNSTDIAEVTVTVRKVYERPREVEADDPTRIQAAKDALNRFSGVQPIPADGGSESVSVTPTQCSNGTVGGASNFVTDDGFTVFNQEDPRWANQAYGSQTIKSSGCGPTSMATIITALTGKEVTPTETTQYADSKGMYIEGAGSSWDIGPVLAANWGLKSKSLPAEIEVINQELRNGGLIITSGTGSAPFTSAGHIITIRGVTETGMWKVADSNGSIGQENSTKEWDPEKILLTANAGNIKVIYK